MADSYYTDGTVSSSGATITGVGTAFETAGIRAGDKFGTDADGMAVRILTVDSETQITLVAAWPGAALSADPYWIEYLADGSRLTASVYSLLQALGDSGNLEALGDLVGAADKLPYFTGAGAMALTDLPSSARTALAAGFASDVLSLLNDANAAAMLTTLGLSTFGKSLVDDADAAAGRTTLGLTANGQSLVTAADYAAMKVLLDLEIGTDVLAYDADLAAVADTGLAAFAGTLWGLTLSNNATDATNDIDIAAGVAIDSTNAALMRLASGITKRLDASWAVGSGNGGLDTGSIADTTYHVYLIKRPDTGVVDAIFSTSASAPTLPTNYTLYRRIGSILREGGSIVAFTQIGDEFLRLVPSPGDYSATNPGTSAVLATLKVPTGIKVNALLGGLFDAHSGTTTSLLITSPDQTDTAPSTSRYDTRINAGLRTGLQGLNKRTNTSAQIRLRVNVSDASTQIILNTFGWIDPRGRI